MLSIDYREYNSKDIPRLMELSHQQEITSNSNLPANGTSEQIERYISRYCDKKYKPLVVLLNKKMVGMVIFNCHLSVKIVNVSYFYDRQYKNQGIATQALQECGDALFRTSECVRQQTIVEPDNVASIRVLEKCGFQREGLLRRYHHKHDELVDVFMYARFRDDTERE